MCIYILVQPKQGKVIKGEVGDSACDIGIFSRLSYFEEKKIPN